MDSVALSDCRQKRCCSGQFGCKIDWSTDREVAVVVVMSSRCRRLARQGLFEGGRIIDDERNKGKGGKKDEQRKSSPHEGVSIRTSRKAGLRMEMAAPSFLKSYTIAIVRAGQWAYSVIFHYRPRRFVSEFVRCTHLLTRQTPSSAAQKERGAGWEVRPGACSVKIAFQREAVAA